MWVLISFAGGMACATLYETAGAAHLAQSHWQSEGVECWVAKAVQS